MIRFLSPGFAWALAVPAVILALYLLRRRYLPQQVPSVFLWRKSVKDHAANRPFQKLMKNLLLPLQLLAKKPRILSLQDPGREPRLFPFPGHSVSRSESRLSEVKRY